MTVFKSLMAVFLFFITAAGSGGVPQNLEVTPLSIETDEGWHRFEVEVARTPEQQSLGLMYRAEMAADHGMIFHYSFPQSVGFWMKNTYISLDLIFILPDGTIADIAHDTQPHSLQTINSPGWVAGVLELNGGLSETLGIEAGDIVHHKIFGNAIPAQDPDND